MKMRVTLFTGLFLAVLGLAASVASGASIAEDATVWDGEPLAFEKADGADPQDASNQDRITESVWLTRGNDGGQIYNAAQESAADKRSSPEGTLWAIGTLDEIEELNFAEFRATVIRPKDIVGKELVLYLVDEKILLEVTFTSWSQAKDGGFSYERSTP